MNPTKNFMLLSIAALWITQSVVLIAAMPPMNTIADDSAMYDPNLFEGDIIITPVEFEKYYGVPHNDRSGNVSNTH